MDSDLDKTERDGLADKSQQEKIDYFPLLELPTELLMTLFEYLDSATVIKTLSKVCKYLADVVADDLIWKVRIHKRWPGKRYPAIARMYHIYAVLYLRHNLISADLCIR